MMRNQIDELMLQRLVDGALGKEERSTFLKEIDDQPELWREVALAYVEEQVFISAIPGIAEISPSRVLLPPKHRRGLRMFARAVALAAVLLLSVFIGYQRGQDAGRASVDVESTTTAAATNDMEMRLKQMGYKVEREYGFIAGSLSDGSPVLVPVQGVQMGYHGV